MFQAFKEKTKHDGVQSARLDRMLDVLEKCVQSILESGVGIEDIRECFEEVSNKSRRLDENHIARLFEKLFRQQVRNNIRDEFIEICKENNMPEKLFQLEQIIEGKEDHSPAKSTDDDKEEPLEELGKDEEEEDISTLEPANVSEELAKVMYHTKTQRLEELQDRMSSLESENRRLQELIQARQLSITSNTEHINALLFPITATKSACAEFALPHQNDLSLSTK